jgi:hypothetical protein
MVIIRFPDPATERRALGFLLGRFSFKTWDTGETMVPEEALAALAHERLSYTVEGPARYEHYVSAVGSPAAPAV